MKTRTTYSLLAALLMLSSAALAAPDTLQKLDVALKSVPAFEYGKDSSALRTIEEIVIQASTDPQQRPAVEDRLIKALSADATRDAREFLCRQLYTIGTARCVPTLEPMLTDPQLSHPARFALGRIDDPAASAALRRALAKTSGKLQIGIIGTLAAKGDRAAISDIAKLLSSPDDSVASAAAQTLGQFTAPSASAAIPSSSPRLGTPGRGQGEGSSAVPPTPADIVKLLQSARPTAREPLARAIDDALLACADHFIAAGDIAQALPIYRSFYASTQPRHLRIAALRGLAAAGGDDALKLLATTIKTDPDLQAIAISFAGQAKGPAATKTLTDLLPALPPRAQELLVIALGGRNDRAAAPAIAAAASSPDNRVRLAAYDALAQIGDASSVELLALAATKNTREEQRAAQAALLRLTAPGTDDALIKLLAGSDPALQAEAARALAGRHAKSAFADLLKLAKSDNESVRRAAIAALGDLAAEPDLPSILALMLDPKAPADRAALDQAITSAFRRIPDPAKRSAPILSAYASASRAAQPALLRLLVNAPTPAALALVSSAAKAADAAIRDAAVRALADWPTAAPADQLLDLARSPDNPTHRILAIRGYVRMAGLSKDPTAMYVRAMELARNDGDKKLVLAGLASASTIQALTLVEQHLVNPQVQAEAALAAIQIATRLKDTDNPSARAAMKKVLAVVEDSSIHQKAHDLLNELEQFEDYILTWTVSDIFKENAGDIAFANIYAPEKPDAVTWKPLRLGLGKWDINLESTFGVVDHCAAYVRTRVWSPRDQQARLEMGADDALKAWLNGKLVFAHYQNRGLQPRSDIVNITLRQGWNDLMLKVVDQEGGWTFCCRIRQPDGSAIDGLKYEAK